MRWRSPLGVIMRLRIEQLTGRVLTAVSRGINGTTAPNWNENGIKIGTAVHERAQQLGTKIGNRIGNRIRPYGVRAKGEAAVMAADPIKGKPDKRMKNRMVTTMSQMPRAAARLLGTLKLKGSVNHSMRNLLTRRLARGTRAS